MKYRTYIRHVSLTYHTNRAPYHRFRQCYDGVKPRGVKKFKEVAEICSALVIVQTAVTPGSCMPCKANPFDFICSCKGGRKTGICAHIDAVDRDRYIWIAEWVHLLGGTCSGTSDGSLIRFSLQPSPLL